MIDDFTTDDSRGEAQAKCGKKDQTQGHYKRKILDLQRQIKLTAKDGARLRKERVCVCVCVCDFAV